MKEGLFVFKYRENAGNWTEYSGFFKTEQDAEKWYNHPEKGGYLRNEFKIKICLFCGLKKLEREWII